eukprot:g13392.t1
MKGTSMLKCMAPATTLAKKFEASKSKSMHLKSPVQEVEKCLATASATSLSIEVQVGICILGIYGCYISAGMLQEAITTYQADDGARFSATLFLMWVPTVTNVVFAYLAMLVNGRSGENLPQHLFGTARLAYIIATVLSVEALKYVNFPTKELGKSCKDKENSAYGLCLLLCSLIFDGVTTSAQERLKAACKPTVHEKMFFMNAWALAILSAAAYFSGQWAEGLLFCSENPLVMCYVLGFSLASAVGQHFIYYTITCFNPFVMTTIATTRKFFSIVSSVIFYGHAIGPNQWGGVVMVFAGIGYEMRCKYRRHNEAKINVMVVAEKQRLISPV